MQILCSRTETATLHFIRPLPLRCEVLKDRTLRLGKAQGVRQMVSGLLLGARTLLELGAPGLTTSNKELLVTKAIATRSKDATSSSWPYY